MELRDLTAFRNMEWDAVAEPDRQFASLILGALKLQRDFNAKAYGTQHTGVDLARIALGMDSQANDINELIAQLEKLFRLYHIYKLTENLIAMDIDENRAASMATFAMDRALTKPDLSKVNVQKLLSY